MEKNEFHHRMDGMGSLMEWMKWLNEFPCDDNVWYYYETTHLRKEQFFSRIKYIHNVWNPAANEMVSMKILLLLHHFTLPLNCGVKREGNGKSSPWNLVIFTLILNLCGSTYLLYTSQTNRCGLVAHIWYWVRGWCPEATFIRFSC